MGENVWRKCDANTGRIYSSYGKKSKKYRGVRKQKSCLLVVYTYEDKEDTDSQLYLARGKNSESDETCWEKSDPIGLVNYVNDKYKGADCKEEREQFRRVVRYMKRWKNKKFSSSGNAEPPSIGITLIAVDKFVAAKKYDYLEEKYLYNDLDALLGFAQTIKSLFDYKGISESGRILYSIEYNLQSTLNFEPNTNVLKKMTDNYMTDFKEKIDALVTDLEVVKNETDEVEQCKKLNKIFGDDFPVPEKKNAAKQQMSYRFDYFSNRKS